MTFRAASGLLALFALLALPRPVSAADPKCKCETGTFKFDPKKDARTYYPLAVGNSWTYAFRGSERQETIRIIGQDGPWYIDDHRGRLRYEKDGVRDSDRYLLHTPLSVGRKTVVTHATDPTASQSKSAVEVRSFIYCSGESSTRRLRAQAASSWPESAGRSFP